MWVQIFSRSVVDLLISSEQNGTVERVAHLRKQLVLAFRKRLIRGRKVTYPEAWRNLFCFGELDRLHLLLFKQVCSFREIALGINADEFWVPLFKNLERV